MYYKIWSQRYLNEAEKLKNHIKSLKTQYVLTNDVSAADDLQYRITILYEMYLELVHTGKYLQRKYEVMNDA